MQLYQNETVSLQYMASHNALLIEFSGIETSYKMKTLENLLRIKKIIPELKKQFSFDMIIAVSKNREVWNYGGDLNYFYNCISNNNREELTKYAYSCIELIHVLNHAFDTNVPSVSIVFGKAYGGGFESALASNIVIADENAKFSFPECNFGSFPGMGAYSILTKKIGFAKAQEIITNNKTLTAKKAHEFGLIDKIITENENIFDVAKTAIADYNKNKFKHIHTKLSYPELKEGVDYWVNQMFKLGDINLLRIQKILHFQKNTKIKPTKKKIAKI